MRAVAPLNELTHLKPLAQAFEQEFDRPLAHQRRGENQSAPRHGLRSPRPRGRCHQPKTPEGVGCAITCRCSSIPYYAFTQRHPWQSQRGAHSTSAPEVLAFKTPD